MRDVRHGRPVAAGLANELVHAVLEELHQRVLVSVPPLDDCGEHLLYTRGPDFIKIDFIKIEDPPYRA